MRSYVISLGVRYREPSKSPSSCSQSSSSSGFPYTSLTDGHVSVDFLTGRLGQRAQYAIIAVNAVICAVLLGVITRQMAALAAEFLATQRTTITMRIPIFPSIVPVTVTAGLAALGFVVQAFGAVLRVFRPGLPPLPTPHRSHRR